MANARSILTDLELRHAVHAELEWDPRVNATHVRVNAKDGAVMLTGTVTTYAHKLAAVRAAERIYGVMAVADDIEVVLAPSVRRKDADIAKEIARLRTSSTSIPEALQVEVTKGKVTLHGLVDWKWQRDDAARVVGHLPGVRSVENRIEIRPHDVPDADAVQRRIEDAIERMADLDARSIRVSASHGGVRLHGTVRSLAERRLAQEVAESAPGVTSVENEIDVAL
jgi:osmotically-inducible protein OsmY